jgi:hypothetical protein
MGVEPFGCEVCVHSWIVQRRKGEKEKAEGLSRQHWILCLRQMNTNMESK